MVSGRNRGRPGDGEILRPRTHLVDGGCLVQAGRVEQAVEPGGHQCGVNPSGVAEGSVHAARLRGDQRLDRGHPRLRRGFTKADASKGGGLYRSPIVAQLAEAARRIQDGVPKSLRPRVFAATADLAALAGWVSHDCGRYPTAQRYWSYGVYPAGEAGQRDRGVEIVTRMPHQNDLPRPP